MKAEEISYLSTILNNNSYKKDYYLHDLSEYVNQSKVNQPSNTQLSKKFLIQDILPYLEVYDQIRSKYAPTNVWPRPILYKSLFKETYNPVSIGIDMAIEISFLLYIKEMDKAYDSNYKNELTENFYKMIETFSDKYDIIEVFKERLLAHKLPYIQNGNSRNDNTDKLKYEFYIDSLEILVIYYEKQKKDISASSIEKLFPIVYYDSTPYIYDLNLSIRLSHLSKQQKKSSSLFVNYFDYFYQYNQKYSQGKLNYETKIQLYEYLSHNNKDEQIKQYLPEFCTNNFIENTTSIEENFTFHIEKLLFRYGLQEKHIPSINQSLETFFTSLRFLKNDDSLSLDGSSIISVNFSHYQYKNTAECTVIFSDMTHKNSFVKFVHQTFPVLLGTVANDLLSTTKKLSENYYKNLLHKTYLHYKINNDFTSQEDNLSNKKNVKGPRSKL